MIDSHTHLDLLDDAEAAIHRAREAGVKGVVSVGTSPASIRAALGYAESHLGWVRVCAGVHPQQAATFDAATWSDVKELSLSPHVCAIGETGFDQYRDYGPLSAQLALFVRHAELASSRGLPLVIHTRAAEQQTLFALDQHARGLDVVMHCFSLSHHLDEVLERGYYVSFAGNVSYKSAGELREAAAKVPHDRLLVETDAPYLSPEPMRGQPNEPAYVRHTLECLAQARGTDVSELAAQTRANAQRLFGFES